MTVRTAAPAGELDTAEKVYAGYFAAQVVLGLGLWVALGASGTVRSWFDLAPERHQVMDAFIFGDIFLIVVGSALSTWAIAGRKSWAVPVVAFTAGGVVYPTLYLLGWVNFNTGTGAIALGVMVVVSTFTCWIAYQVWKLSLRRPRG